MTWLILSCFIILNLQYVLEKYLFSDMIKWVVGSGDGAG